MEYRKLTPAGLLSLGTGAPEVAERAWRVRWDGVADAAGTVLGALPDVLEFHTSGSTGPSRCWRRTREDAWREAGMLAEFVRRDAPEAVVSFAPPVHVYGALATLLLPARLGVPVWYRPGYIGGLPETGVRRAVVVATPWIFSLLLRHMDWVRSLEHVTVLYSSAMLPSDAAVFLREAGPGRAAVVELLGSTETGGVAVRRWSEGEPPAWTLFPDVEFAGDTGSGGDAAGTAVPLLIRSPRLAHLPGEPAPREWATGDLVEPVDARTFRLLGRTGRLVKINGQRINLDEAEHTLRARLDCADLALVPVNDPMIGEHVDLYLVPRPEARPAGADLAAVRAVLGARPRKTHVVPALSRSAMGKLQHLTTSHSPTGIPT
ncbi:long-chain fatty acid--CoA ligase [Streptomyces sp. WAC07149]|uniref:AMP-binding protein n=1 Tax=Streptomyces sp. WAC07149 TaxID=2487425 RepID=UPI000F79D9D1|nr:AMP-binding protein [Streptomyces sp. WAC07149]RST05411.1 long-chain fatty acid--CoA ligase [Streptomyces sp. WAC07149]